MFYTNLSNVVPRNNKFQKQSEFLNWQFPHMNLCSAVHCVRILEHYVTIMQPNHVSCSFQMVEDTPQAQWFVNTLTKEIQGEKSQNIAAEYSDIELVTDLKSQSAKAI